MNGSLFLMLQLYLYFFLSLFSIISTWLWTAVCGLSISKHKTCFVNCDTNWQAICITFLIAIRRNACISISVATPASIRIVEMRCAHSVARSQTNDAWRENKMIVVLRDSDNFESITNNFSSIWVLMLVGFLFFNLCSDGRRPEVELRQELIDCVQMKCVGFDNAGSDEFWCD